MNMDMEMMSIPWLLCALGLILLLTLVVLGIAALVKYLRSGSKER